MARRRSLPATLPRRPRAARSTVSSALPQSASAACAQNEQAADAEKLGFWIGSESLEVAPCRSLVAIELSRLRGNQPDKGRPLQELAGTPGELLSLGGVAGSDRDQSARQSLIAATLAGQVAFATPSCRSLDQPAPGAVEGQHGKQDGEHDGTGEGSRRLNPQTLPLKGDPARVVREPGRGASDRGQGQEQDQGAPHQL
jgi:hypothetical protein